MKSSWILTALSLATTGLSTETSPFYAPAQASNHNKRAYEALQHLAKRVANNCPGGYNPCSNLNNINVCCKTDARCARDEADNIACCPSGASCTGSLITEPMGTTSSFKFPQYATASATDDESTCGPIETGSTISGPYPFIYVPTTFSDATTCSSYYSRCQTDYTRCTASLGNGGGYGVTVAGNGAAGVTVDGGSSPTSVCSALELEACHGLNLGYCNSYNTGQQDNENAASVGRTSLQDLFFGVAVGLAGMFI